MLFFSQKVNFMLVLLLSNVATPGNTTVRNPLRDISNNGSQSATRGKSSDLEKDVILIDKENIVVPDSVSPSPFRRRSRFVGFKVFFHFFFQIIYVFFLYLLFLYCWLFFLDL
jgi:hypothetical protein